MRRPGAAVRAAPAPASTSAKNAIGPHCRSANAPLESTAIESSTSASATGATARVARGPAPGGPLGPGCAARCGEMSSVARRCLPLWGMRLRSARHRRRRARGCRRRPSARIRADRRPRAGQPVRRDLRDPAGQRAARRRADADAGAARAAAPAASGGGRRPAPAPARRRAAASRARGTVSPIHSRERLRLLVGSPGRRRSTGGKLPARAARNKAGSGKSCRLRPRRRSMTSPAERLGPPRARRSAPTPSKSRAYLLLALALAVAAGLGVAGRSRRAAPLDRRAGLDRVDRR